jgi:hypothetical protein
MVQLSSLLLPLSMVGLAFAAPVAEPAADFELDIVNNGTHIVRRQDYNQDYKTGGNVNYQPTGNGYSVTFSNAQDFVVGKGWKTGTSRLVVFTTFLLNLLLTVKKKHQVLRQLPGSSRYRSPCRLRLDYQPSC